MVDDFLYGDISVFVVKLERGLLLIALEAFPFLLEFSLLLISEKKRDIRFKPDWGYEEVAEGNSEIFQLVFILVGGDDLVRGNVCCVWGGYFFSLDVDFLNCKFHDALDWRLDETEVRVELLEIGVKKVQVRQGC